MHPRFVLAYRPGRDITLVATDPIALSDALITQGLSLRISRYRIFSHRCCRYPSLPDELLEVLDGPVEGDLVGVHRP